MACMDDYLEVNRLNWDERATVHAASAEYGFDRFVTTRGSAYTFIPSIAALRLLAGH